MVFAYSRNLWMCAAATRASARVPRGKCGTHIYSFGELSLSLSHLRAIAAAEPRGEEHALIVEDDFRLGDLLGRWPQVEKLAASAPSDW